MTDASAPRPLNKWRYGIHPQAAGTQLEALGRVELPLGEALRLEMATTRRMPRTSSTSSTTSRPSRAVGPLDLVSEGRSGSPRGQPAGVDPAGAGLALDPEGAAGQYEAAKAVGLSYWQSMRLIILPQALKIVIPGIVNSFISLFKDTSLVLIIGIFDLLGIVQSNFTDANWASPETPATGYVFAAMVFWMFCFGMSRYSIYTERRLDTGYRR